MSSLQKALVYKYQLKRDIYKLIKSERDLSRNILVVFLTSLTSGQINNYLHANFSTEWNFLYIVLSTLVILLLYCFFNFIIHYNINIILPLNYRSKKNIIHKRTITLNEGRAFVMVTKTIADALDDDMNEELKDFCIYECIDCINFYYSNLNPRNFISASNIETNICAVKAQLRILDSIFSQLKMQNIPESYIAVLEKYSSINNETMKKI